MNQDFSDQWRTGDMDQSTGYGDANYYSGTDVQMDEQPPSESDGAPKKKYMPWVKIGPDGRPIKRKPNLAKRNQVFRKAVQPRNAVMCLNELQPGLKYTTESMQPSVGNCCVTVEVNGQVFRGYGSNKDLAKHAAAEAALVSFVKPPVPKTTDSDQQAETDSTPWKTLASFAMYKLFSDWREGRIGMSSPGSVPNPMQAFQMMSSQAMQNAAAAAAAAVVKDENSAETMSTLAAHLKRHTPETAATGVANTGATATSPAAATTPKPIKGSKVNTEAQRTRHPVMVLHQLFPSVQYTSVESLDANNAKIYTVSATINGQTFSGEATAIKKAKIQLAKAALKGLYDIDNIYESA